MSLAPSPACPACRSSDDIPPPPRSAGCARLMAAAAGPEIERLVSLLSKLPGLGPRSARRAALALLKRREQLMDPLVAAMSDASARVRPCSTCGALDTCDPCTVCRAPERDGSLICVVEEVGAMWAMERAGAYRGRY